MRTRDPVPVSWLLLLVVSAVASGADNQQAPLRMLPSPSGDHVARVAALRDDAWLDLGKPKPDPRWGSARGRSWTAKMPYAPELRAAFLFGEGVHGWWNKQTGRYMDDLWAYDINAHAWVCVHPGTDMNALNLKLNPDGIEVNQGGMPVPVAQMVHGYEGTTYDIDLRRFMFMPCSGGYWEKAMGDRRMNWLGRKSNEVARNCSPWLYNVRDGTWDRRKTAAPSPGGAFGDVLIYVPTGKRTFLRTRGTEVWWYDANQNAWTRVSPGGPPPPFGIDPTACYDSKRDRIYVGGGSYPVADGPNALWIYDVKTDTWIDPKPAGRPCGGANSYNTNIATMTYDTANDVVVLNRHKGTDGQVGLWIYDPTANAWQPSARPFPQPGPWKGQVNAFYDPQSNVHTYHTAGDSEPGGSIRVYRFKAGNAEPAALPNRKDQ